MYKIYKSIKISLIHSIKWVLVVNSIVFIGLAWLYFYRVFNDFKTPYVEGDGFEYVLMTESFYNHYSPDLQKTDIESFKLNVLKFNSKWDEFPKSEYLNNALWFDLNDKNIPFKYDLNGFFHAKNNKYYSYHFFTYSLLCVPAKAVCMFFNYPTLYAFPLTNAVFVCIVIILLLFYFTQNKYVNIAAAICFSFGSNYWYLGWEHTEIFTTSLVAISLILFFRKRWLLSLLFVALATSQNQPLLLLSVAMGLLIWREYHFKLEYLWRLLVIGLVAIVPSIFYYYHYETTNLIKDSGKYLDSNYITLNRVFGFYFDLNQGMLLAIPLVLIIYISLMLHKIVRSIKLKQIDFDLVFPLVMLIITFIIASMMSWNPAQAIVHRYTTWMGAILFIHCFYLIANINSKVLILILSFLTVILQTVTCFYFQKINTVDFEQCYHNPIAKLVLKKYPNYYNPDPVIFQIRTAHNYNELPVYVYFDSDKNIKKVMVKKTSIDSLKAYGMTKKLRKRLLKYNDQYGWIYLKEEDHKYLKTAIDIYENIYKQQRIRFYAEEIKRETQWKKVTEDRIKAGGKYDDLIKEFSNYLFYLEEQNLIGAKK
jgi:hypothetical protein